MNFEEEKKGESEMKKWLWKDEFGTFYLFIIIQSLSYFGELKMY